MATSQAGQAELQGLLLGAGTNYIITNLRHYVEARPVTVPRLLGDGDYQGQSRGGNLVVELTVTVLGSTFAALASNVLALRAAWDPRVIAPIVLQVFEATARTCTGFPSYDDPGYSTGGASRTVPNFGLRFVAGTPTWT